MLLAIDPGTEQSVYVLMDEDLKPLHFGKLTNDELLGMIMHGDFKFVANVAIEMIASYGMPVGATVFETCLWIGKFILAVDIFYGIDANLIYRKDVKMNLCGTTKAKDGNIRQALIDRFGEVGVKKAPGWFYGFKADIWAAYAVGVTYHDMKREVTP